MGQKHFILGDGACHGAWCWYKIKPLLQAAGHRVTLLDMAGAGVNRNTIYDVHSLAQYSEPLLQTLASLPPNEKVILVGHSLGGMNLAVAMENYPEKIAVSVFLTAFARDTVHKPSYVIDQFSLILRHPIPDILKPSNKRHLRVPLRSLARHPVFSGNADDPLTSLYFGPKFMYKKLYHLSPPEDVELGLSLLRPSSLFREELAKAKNFSEEKYGSVTKVYVVCGEDQVITKQFQKWMIDNAGIKNVIEIDSADHIPMFSEPRLLVECLLQIALNYT